MGSPRRSPEGKAFGYGEGPPITTSEGDRETGFRDLFADMSQFNSRMVVKRLVLRRQQLKGKA
jgi:hypothetical protein